ncbi:MAG: GNAT family N-acetyltransferase [Candidatus Edwardsbacteria bacterium]
MKLTLDRLEAYVTLTKADKTEEERRKEIEELGHDFKSGKRNLEDYRVMEDTEGQIIASIRICILGEGFSVLTELVTRKGIPDTERDRATSLIFEAVERARTSNVLEIGTRIDISVFFDRYGLALSQAGFVFRGARIEYKSRVTELPEEQGTPIKWESMDTVGFEMATRLLWEVSQGQPDADPEEDPAQALKAFLDEPDLNGTPECVHVGFLDGQPAALVIAQVNPSTGWSRITHMGIVPTFRGQGLGKWAHRHGFAMIRAQKGELYHGGCSAENAAMIALFKRHGCKEVVRMHEWKWKASRTPLGTGSDQEMGEFRGPQNTT